MSDDNFTHVPVLANEVVSYLAAVNDGPRRFIDGTVGYGGHSSLILKNNVQAELLGIDRDGKALSSAQKVLNFAGKRVHLERGSFSYLADFADQLGWHLVDGILLDLGVSSPQLDNPARGFSYRLNGPLDMRMDNRDPVTACRFLNSVSEVDLEKILRQYGEIKRSRRLAQAIVERRKEKAWTTTTELAELCDKVLGKSKPGKLPSPTLCFQAIRIAINDELGELENALGKAVDLLKPDGRILVISFHSLEDRIVKNFFRHENSECICPPGLPICACDHKKRLNIITKKPIIAGEEELAVNRRAACAKLRVAERI